MLFLPIFAEQVEVIVYQVQYGCILSEFGCSENLRMHIFSYKFCFGYVGNYNTNIEVFRYMINLAHAHFLSRQMWWIFENYSLVSFYSAGPAWKIKKLNHTLSFVVLGLFRSNPYFGAS